MVTIHNKNIQLFLETVFNKGIQDITDADLLEIEDIPFEGMGEEHVLDFTDLPLFPNVKSIHISDAMVSKSDLEKIKHVSRVRFSRCAFEHEEDLTQLKMLTSLAFQNCYFNQFDFLGAFSNLTNLEITRPKTEVPIDCSLLSSLSNIEDMVLNFCKVDHFEDIKNLTTLKSLSLLGVPLPEDCLGVIEQLPNLEELYIDSDYTELDYISRFRIHTDYNQFMFIEEPKEVVPEKGI